MNWKELLILVGISKPGPEPEPETLEVNEPLPEHTDITTILGHKFTCDEVVEIVDHMIDGKKVNAIKTVRRITGQGLKEAKGMVDAGYFDPGPVDEEEAHGKKEEDE